MYCAFILLKHSIVHYCEAKLFQPVDVTLCVLECTKILSLIDCMFVCCFFLKCRGTGGKIPRILARSPERERETKNNVACETVHSLRNVCYNESLATVIHIHFAMAREKLQTLTSIGQAIYITLLYSYLCELCLSNTFNSCANEFIFSFVVSLFT